MFSYVYNQVPELLNAVIASSKQITTDVMVHQGTFIYIQPCFTIEYDRTYSVSVVNSSIFTQLQTYFTALPFGVSIKLSVLQMVVQQVYGVVSCEVTTEGSGVGQSPTNYGVQVFTDGTGTQQVSGSPYTSDFKLADNQIANFLGVNTIQIATP